MKEPQAIVDEGRRLFNERRFWHVHEALEALWLVKQGKEKDLLQGLILIAASLVHAGNHKMDIAWPMMERALVKLEGQPDHYYGWDVRKFRDHFARVWAERKLEFPTV
jgi:predicted metal-dependent hydrolase